MMINLDANLSFTWLKTFISLYENGNHEKSPCIVSIKIENEALQEDAEIRNILDEYLLKLKEKCCQTVASTIFPVSLWNREKNADFLFKRYKSCWPLIRKADQNNSNGTYFQRMTNFNIIVNPNEDINQLKEIINTWKNNNHRRSALHAAIFDPRKDHSNSRIKVFPCLQQVAFNPIGKNGNKGFEVTGFYANQTMLEKAYGNYLGLYWLGKFMAHEMNLKLSKVNCIASVLKLTSNKSIQKITPLYEELKKYYERKINSI